MKPLGVRKLKSKYGAAAIARGLELEPATFLRKVQIRDLLDQHYTKLWLDYGYGGLSRRAVLDDRTYILVLVGQFAMRGNQAALADALRGGMRMGIVARELLEVVIQTQLYGGTSVTDKAMETVYQVMEEVEVGDQIRDTQLPIDGRLPGRSLARERESWESADTEDARLDRLLERHGWHGISVGLRLRPGHHLNIVEYFDALDENFTSLWLQTTYAGYYDRHILDDKTRLLCMVGNCIALGEEVQGRSHMAGAMRAGAHPRDLLEIVFQSSFYFGQPAKVNFLRVLVRVLDDHGRLAEIGDPPAPVR